MELAPAKGVLNAVLREQLLKDFVHGWREARLVLAAWLNWAMRSAEHFHPYDAEIRQDVGVSATHSITADNEQPQHIENPRKQRL